MKNKMKVTVIDKKLYPELQQQYCLDPNSGACPCYNVGDEFIFYRDDERNDFWRMGLNTLVKTNADPDTVAGGRIHNQHPDQRVKFMNMCMISDGQGNVVMLKKMSSNYRGATFPGGHIERNETFSESVIREVREETGLIIENPKLCGVYYWFIDSVHQIVYIYLAERYTGELSSSEEGEMCWISEKEFFEKDLAPGMEAVVRLVHDDTLSECYLWNEEGCWKERLL